MFFQAVKSKIAYATDTWTTPQMVYTFACSVGCFIDDDWEIIECVINFKPLEDKEHKGLYGGKAFVDGACKIGSFDKINFTCDSARSNCLPPSRLHCISVSTDNASVNNVIIATIAQICLARYGIPPSPNLHIHCVCHVVNLVVQAILAALGEADDPDEVDYYTLNKEQPLHFDIDADPDQIELDSEEFQDVEDEMTHEENITLEEEEKLKATASPLSKVRISHVKFSYFGMLMFMLATLHYKQNCLVTLATEEVSEMHNLNISQEKLRVQRQARGLGGGSRCPYMLELHTCDDSSS